MIRILLVCGCLMACIGGASAQMKQKRGVFQGEDWQLRALDTDGVYGAEVWKAYDYLKGYHPKVRTVVAIIDGGADVTHEDLKGSLWVNRGEIPGNGVDDDGNGYVDDVHGWNFVGNVDGSQLEEGCLERDREYAVLSVKYAGVDTSRLSKKGLREYRYFKEQVEPFSSIHAALQDVAGAEVAEKYAVEIDRMLREMFPDKKYPLLRNFMKMMDERKLTAEQESACRYFANLWRKEPMSSWSHIYEKRYTLVENARAEYQKRLDRTLASESARAALGDRQGNWRDRKYGNNNLFGEKSSLHGMHVGGIVGATRHNGLGIDGVADVELMFLRISEGDGDERDKDVASAIFYAVENGARVINMSFGKPTSPYKKVVDQALRYAEKKGVICVRAAGNEGNSIEGAYLYPSKYITAKRALKNWICVGSIGREGQPAKTSNYGKTAVDIFAPGVGVYSSVPKNGYRELGGTSMAAPVVSGVIALIWNYFPELSAEEVRRAVLEGVTSRKGEMVFLPGRGANQVDFGELCATGGILNALEAVKLAEKMYNGKMN